MMRNALMTTTLFASALLAACAPTPQREATEVTPVPPSTTAAYNHAAEVEAWRIDRLERLQKPEGWLSPVSYTHLTLPTTYSVSIPVVAVSLKKKLYTISPLRLTSA